MITSTEESLAKLTAKCSEELEKGTHPFFKQQLLSFFSDKDLKNNLPAIKKELQERKIEMEFYENVEIKFTK